MLLVVGRAAVVEAVASFQYKQHLPLALALAIACTHRKPFPAVPTKHVTDDVAFLSSAATEVLEARLHAYEQRSKHQVYVWVTGSANGEAYPDFTFRIFNAWGIGRERFDDGVLLFIFVKDDMRWITVGYGLEAAIPDRDAVFICREVIAPKMRAGKSDLAVAAGVDAIIAKIDQWEQK
jgi:uncharacterized protein